jgi:DNA-binding XRE family transcriptional regulator
MFHKAVSASFLSGTLIEVRFQDGKVKHYDISVLFSKYPQLKALEDENLFKSGRLVGHYGIIWNDDLDLETETIYMDGKTVRTEPLGQSFLVGEAVAAARADANLSQKQLSALTGIDQSDISKIERGLANPSVSTLERLSKAMGKTLTIQIL